jgi:hypothetical protein
LAILRYLSDIILKSYSPPFRSSIEDGHLAKILGFESLVSWSGDVAVLAVLEQTLEIQGVVPSPPVGGLRKLAVFESSGGLGGLKKHAFVWRS